MLVLQRSPHVVVVLLKLEANQVIYITVKKTSPDDATVKANLNLNPWHDLNFAVSKPFYFQYSYENYSITTSNPAAVGGFTAKAAACLNCTAGTPADGKTPSNGQYIYSISGTETGTGNIVEGLPST